MTLLSRLRFCSAVLCLITSLQAESQTRTFEISLSEAVQSVIQKHPLIRYQEAQIDIDKGLKLQASGAFDTTLSAGLAQSRTTTPLTAAEQEQYALIGVNGGNEATDLTQGNFGVSRLFRSGVSVGGTWTVSRNVDNLLNPQGVNITNPAAQVTVPLLQGRGQKVVAAHEMAAQAEVTAGTFDLTNETATLIVNAASDYWNVVAGQKLVAIAKEAEGRARTDLDNTQTLVSADRLPRENLNEVSANVEQSASTRFAAEQNAIAAEYQLATDIGMDRQEIASASLVAEDGFPQAPTGDAFPFTEGALKAFVADALHNRSDYRALETRISEQAMLVTAAKNRLLPVLNITVGGGYNGLQEGRRFKDIFTSTGTNVDGPNASGAVTYTFPPRNDLARGAYLQAVATQTQLEAQSLQLSHSITSVVLSAAWGVRNAALEVGKAQSAVRFYRDSLTGQREKYHVGIASVVDVLTVEDRLTTAMTTEVQAELAYALALAQFRFATGTIVPPGKAVVRVDAGIFQGLPASGPPVPQP